MSDCSSHCYDLLFFCKRRKRNIGTGNAVLDNIFERKSVRACLNKGVEKENRLDASCRNGCSYG